MAAGPPYRDDIITNSHRHKDYGPAGCGLGSIMFGSSKQALAASFNITGFNSFAISSGSSNCHAPSGKLATEERQRTFFIANYATLAKEAARGDGEALTGLAGEFGCRAGVDQRMGAQMREHYGAIFGQPGAVAAFSATLRQIRREPSLAVECVDL